ncbi:T9SS type A sorting domain-containing protein [bacterium]|nr:T9SS type A sorting domain-containing protein [bacterium]
MRYLFVSIAILSIAIFPIFADVSPTLLSDDYNRTVFQIDLPNPVLADIGEGYTQLSLDGFGYCGEKYGPQLYGRTFWVAVPKNARLDISIISVEWSEWLDIKPSPLCSLSTKFGIPGPADQKLYSQNFGGTVKIGSDNIWRGVRVVGVDIVPVEYVPELGVRFIKNLQISLEHSGGKGNIYDERLYNAWFAQLYKASLVNPDAATPPEPPAAKEWNPDDGAELLIICYTSFMGEIEPWTNWKLYQGMPTKVVTTDVTGTSTSSVKAYIQNAYDTWALPPTYVLLVGDAENIETYQSYSEGYGDHRYSYLDGGDEVADVFVGRMSGNSTANLSVIVQKHLNYEKQPDTTDDWYARAVGIVNEDGESHSISPSYCANLQPGDSSYLVAVTYGMDSCCVPAGFTSVQLFRRCNGDDFYDVQPYVEAGLGFVQYRGQAWPDYYYNFSGGLDTLDNDGKCPINISITCGTGGFMFSGRMCERATRATTPTHPKGATCFIGQTQVSSNSIERSSLSKHIFQGLFPQKLNPLGEAYTYGRNQLWAEFSGSSNAQFEFRNTSMLGSPEMLIWTAPIMPPVVSHPDAVPPETVNVDVTVQRDGVPLENARVALHHGSDFSYGITNSSGFVSVRVYANPAESLILVVTGPNIYPYVDTIPTIMGGIAVYCVPTTYYDISGDSDGLINPGETISFTPKITNYGDETGTHLVGVIRTNDPQITILDSTTVFPNVAPNDTVDGDTVAFVLSANHPAIDQLIFTLVISGDTLGPWERTVVPQPEVYRFDANLDNVQIIDTVPFGNGNGQIEQGEDVELKITLANNTQADVFSMGGTLYSETGDVAVAQNSAFFGDITRMTARISSPSYYISVSPDASPGEYITLQLALAGNCPMYTSYDTIEILLAVAGDTAGLPTGPDSYGYYIVDNTDSSCGITPTFEWVDITGVGTTIAAITNSDDGITDIALPFTMKFYGNSYDSISVSSNGFLAPPGCAWSGGGSGTPQAFPTSGGPSGIIGPIWSDLAPHRTSGDIYSYYDSPNHQFIIQYNTTEFYYGGGSITCQIKICDPAYYSTPTGDSELYFYYNYVDISGYAGVGIESPDEIVGLQYYLNGGYDIHAATLQSGRVLRITTVEPIYATYPWLYYLNSLLYQDESKTTGIIEPGDNVNMKFRLKNGGMDNANFTSCSAVSTDYITSVSTANFGVIAAGDSAYNSGSPVVFTISTSCPPETTLVVPIAVSANFGAYKDTIAFLIDVGSSVNVREDEVLPSGISISQPYPNPFNSVTSFDLNIGYNIGKTDANISVYSLLGKKVSTIYSGELSAGKHKFDIDARDFTSGIYFVKLVVNNRIYRKRILLIK